MGGVYIRVMGAGCGGGWAWSAKGYGGVEGEEGDPVNGVVHTRGLLC